MSFCVLVLCASLVARSAALALEGVRAVSLDVTGTIVTHRGSVTQAYCDAAVWARLPDAPTPAELKPAFAKAYKERCIESPCFGGVEGVSGRQWWRATVRRVLELAGRSYDDAEFDRYFRRVYQHFASPGGYETLSDAAAFLAAAPPGLLLGITSNTPSRHMNTVLPMLGIHDHFKWFACSQDVGAEKPSPKIFQVAFDAARFWVPDLEKDEVLHVGDSLACDFCGARAFGFQALFLDRSANPNVVAYQDWVDAPDYEGKSEADIRACTVTSLEDVLSALT